MDDFDRRLKLLETTSENKPSRESIINSTDDHLNDDLKF